MLPLTDWLGVTSEYPAILKQHPFKSFDTCNKINLLFYSLIQVIFFDVIAKTFENKWF